MQGTGNASNKYRISTTSCQKQPEVVSIQPTVALLLLISAVGRNIHFLKLQLVNKIRKEAQLITGHDGFAAVVVRL